MSSIPRLSKRHPLKLADNNDEMRDLLKWLWLSAVKPVLEHLGYLSPPSSSALPRIWWITNGIMSMAPFHAAGIYEDAGGQVETAMDFVVSSYISTARALNFARAKAKVQQQTAESKERALLITATDKDLDFETEIQGIQETIGKHYEPVMLKDASRKDVLYHLENSSIMHFACHGISIGFEPPKSPSDSYLLLKGTKEDLGNECNEKLTIDDLASVRNPSARLAYLSACSTAKVPTGKLIDEMIHIANAFQLAGYPHVVGTLWEAENESAGILSRSFYEFFLGDDDKVPGLQTRDVAVALNQAVRKLMRDPDWGEDFVAWVPFVHIGA
ncbi:hypothetical protein TWF281_005097 [Arthrobotrys megalospora]